jgi:broad specificity phosphatase PhoE
MECWLVRHGESTWNSVGRFQGGLDAPLSPRGLDQARALAAGLAATRFDGLLPTGRLLGWNETGHLTGVGAEAAAP